MLTDISVLTQTSIAGVTPYGIGLLFIKAILIVIVAQTLAEQLEFYPAGIRHTVWLLAVISLAFLPLLNGMLPAWKILFLEYPAATLDVIPTIDLGIAPEFNWLDWLVLLYLSVLGILLARLLFSLLRIAITTVRSTQACADWYDLARDHTNRRINIRISSLVSGPLTWGILRPVILLPTSANELPLKERKMVIQHEIGHIHRADWLTQILANLVAILYWPVPGVRRILLNLSLEAERACDNIVLRRGVLPDEYAALLVHQAKLTTLPATVALGSASELVQRVRHIVSNYIDRADEIKYQLGLTLIAAILIFPLAAAKAGWRLPVTGNSFSRPVSLVVPLPGESASLEFEENSISRPQKPAIGSEPAPRQGSESMNAGVNERQATYLLMSDPVVKADIQLRQWRTPAIRILQSASPEYPSVAMKRGIEGEVLVEFDIDARGLVENPRIISSSPGTVFDRAVITALKAYRFAPPRIGDQEVSLSGVRKKFRFQFGGPLSGHGSNEENHPEADLKKIDSG